MWFTIGLMLGAICGLIVCSCAMVSQITSLENMIASQRLEIMDLKNKVNKEYLYDDFDEKKIIKRLERLGYVKKIQN